HPPPPHLALLSLPTRRSSDLSSRHPASCKPDRLPRRPPLENVFRLSALGSRLSALGSRLSAVGSRLSALGCRLAALGCRLAALRSGEHTSELQSRVALVCRFL